MKSETYYYFSELQLNTVGAARIWPPSISSNWALFCLVPLFASLISHHFSSNWAFLTQKLLNTIETMLLTQEILWVRLFHLKKK